MDHLPHPGIAPIEVLQELDPEGDASAPVILVEKKGVRDTAGVDHPAQGIEKFTHFVRTALSFAMKARISRSGQSGKTSRACRASAT